MLRDTKVFVNSFPKSGTNLVEKLLRLVGIRMAGKSIAMSSVLGRYETIKKLTRTISFNSWAVPIGLEVPVSVTASWLKEYIDSLSPGQYMTGHAAYSDYLESLLSIHSICVLQVVRDPRAILSSMAKYVVEDINAWYPFHQYFKSLDTRSSIRLFILGGPVPVRGFYYSGIHQIILRQIGWFESKQALVVRFEDLIGEKGGGNDATQKATIRRIVEFIGLSGEFRDHDFRAIQEKLFGGTPTFRQGRIDNWRESFDDELEELLLRELQGIPEMIRLGYLNSDGSWAQ